jgi:hypothetical protein
MAYSNTPVVPVRECSEASLKPNPVRNIFSGFWGGIISGAVKENVFTCDVSLKSHQPLNFGNGQYPCFSEEFVRTDSLIVVKINANTTKYFGVTWQQMAQNAPGYSGLNLTNKNCLRDRILPTFMEQYSNTFRCR